MSRHRKLQWKRMICFWKLLFLSAELPFAKPNLFPFSFLSPQKFSQPDTLQSRLKGISQCCPDKCSYSFLFRCWQWHLSCLVVCTGLIIMISKPLQYFVAHQHCLAGCISYLWMTRWDEGVGKCWFPTLIGLVPAHQYSTWNQRWL